MHEIEYFVLRTMIAGWASKTSDISYSRITKTCLFKCVIAVALIKYTIYSDEILYTVYLIHGGSDQALKPILTKFRKNVLMHKTSVEFGNWKN